MIAEAAKTQGVVVKRDDPLMAAVLLNKAILQRYLNHAIGPIQQAIAEAATRAQQAIAEAVTQARNVVSEHAREQAAYVDQVMFKDREQFVAEQKASLEALDGRLLNREAAVAKIMTDILEQSRVTFADEMKKAVKEHTNPGAYNPNQRPKNAKKRAALGALALGIAVGVIGTLGTLIILLRLGVVGVVGAGQ
ncbi:MAG: hypothetical protein WBG92_04160 [Thiohalocapsa sp.]